MWTNQVSSNGASSVDSNPLEPPRPTQSKLGPEPDLPLIEMANSGPIVDPLFSESEIHIEEIGDDLGLFAFGEFNISSPTKGPLGHVERTGKRSERTYALTSVSGRLLAQLQPTDNIRLWVLVDPTGRQLGEYSHNERFGVDMLMPISLGGDQIAEIRSHDGGGKKLTISDLSGPLITINRPKGFFADTLSTLDKYVMTRHRLSSGFLAYLALMAPVAIDEARYRRDLRRR